MTGRGGKIVKTLMDGGAFEKALEEMAQKITADTVADDLRLVGIRTVGEDIARKLAATVSAITGKPADPGVLDITLYRDDIALAGAGRPKVRGTRMPFSVEGADVVIVDDVIWTGRTARAAVEAVMDYGRPARVRLAVAADRTGGRELPIQPDYLVLKTEARRGLRVTVSVNKEKGGVFIRKK